MRRTRRLDGARWFWWLPVASTLLACSSQVQSDYPGEPIATLRGFVASRAALESVPDLRAAIVWNTSDPRYIGEDVAVSGSFPASFSLDLYAAPPPEAEVKTDTDYCIEGETINTIQPGTPCPGHVVPAGTRMGMWQGYLAAVDSRIEEGEIGRNDIVGIDVDHMLVYYDHDDPADRPLPAMPTDEEIAQRMEFVSVGYPDQPESYEAGYRLVKFNPTYQALAEQGRECRWEDLCVHWTRSEGYSQDEADWEFLRCTERFPENPTCNARIKDLAEGESAASSECRERYESLGHHCGWSTGESALSDNPAGLDDPITIQLGLTYFDASW